MDRTIMDYAGWMNLLKGNYRKGVGSLRGILSNPETAAQMTADAAAVMAIYGDVDYTDGSCLCAKEIGGTEYAPPAFNYYLNLMGVSDKESWEESISDLETLKKIGSDEKLQSILNNSPALAIPKRSINDDSWEFISEAGKYGLHTAFYSIGDVKQFTVGAEEVKLEAQIADFDHDYLDAKTSAETAPITFLMKLSNTSTERLTQYESGSNSGGYPGAYLANNDRFYNMLPEDLKNSIREIYKAWGKGNNNNNAEWHKFKVWYPLAWELFDNPVNAQTAERDIGNARKYPIFTDDASRIRKFLFGGEETVRSYWTGSPKNSGSADFVVVSETGQESTAAANIHRGGLYGFCV